MSDLTPVTLEEENIKHGICLSNEQTTLANQPQTTVHTPNDDHQTSSCFLQLNHSPTGLHKQ